MDVSTALQSLPHMCIEMLHFLEKCTNAWTHEGGQKLFYIDQFLWPEIKVQQEMSTVL